MFTQRMIEALQAQHSDLIGCLNTYDARQRNGEAVDTLLVEETVTAVRRIKRALNTLYTRASR